MNFEIRMPSQLRATAMSDLSRPHPFAFERVGFFSSVTSWVATDRVIILLNDYHVVPDHHYLDDPEVGASIGSDAILEALGRVLGSDRGQFHVHIHDHRGRPSPSWTDRAGLPPMLRSFSVAAPEQASGYIILSQDAAWAEVSLLRIGQPFVTTKITSIGFPQIHLL